MWLPSARHRQLGCGTPSTQREGSCGGAKEKQGRVGRAEQQQAALLGTWSQTSVIPGPCAFRQVTQFP